ncbi:uncharacterized protein JCM15063_003454 [Sporobolomyces koalae]|uniref:uncharacterized protein n=1 Tax=Sporobolomyces koalae TaxID=500713 RepID=UPI00317F872B
MDPSTSAQVSSEAAQVSLSTLPTSSTGPSSSETLAMSDLPDELPEEEVYALVMKWRGTPHELQVAASDTVGDLKAILFSLTGVPPDRMKLVGLLKGKLPGDEEEVVNLGLGTAGKKKEFMMIGTPEGEEHKSIGPVSTGDEPDIDYVGATKEALKAMESVRNRRKLKETAEKLQIDQMSAPRSGKKLLVLDLDGCILDTSLWKETNFSTQMFMRPYLHDFLRFISPHYDIIIWSQTSWRWLEQKLVELDVIGPSKRADYPVVTTIDRKPMFSVYSERNGQPFKHEVKALGLLWSKFPGQYSAKNTVHIDDLSRNFAMNPKNGIKVHAYRDALSRDNVSKDIELLYCARYLLQLAAVQDVTELDHSRFRKSKLPLPPGAQDPLQLATPEQLAAHRSKRAHPPP